MSRERDIIGAVKTQLEAIDGTGSYTHDLSGVDQVTIGAKFSPNRVPAAYLFATGTSTNQSAGSTLLTHYDRRMLIQIEAWASVSQDDSGEAHLVALDLQNDLMLAIEADRTLGGYVQDVEVAATTYEGDEWDHPSLALVVCQITAIYAERGGA